MLILVTGGLGYIGSHTVVRLCQLPSFKIVIVDNLCNSDISVLDKLRAITCSNIGFEKVDLCNRTEMERVFTTYSFDAVIHFAALKSVPESVDKPLLYFRNNLDSTIVLLETMQAHNVKNLVFSSSCSVYGNPECDIVDEHTPFGIAESPYAATKQMCEEIIRMTRGVDSVVLRYFNPNSAIEGLPKCEKSLVSLVCGSGDLKVFGSDYPTHDGSPSRDYVHIEDIADGHVCALAQLARLSTEQKSPVKEIYNLGSGQSFTVLDVIRVFEVVTGTKRAYEIVDRRPGDVGKICGDITLAREKLGWEPHHTLEEMVLSCYKHSIKNRLVE